MIDVELSFMVRAGNNLVFSEEAASAFGQRRYSLVQSKVNQMGDFFPPLAFYSTFKNTSFYTLIQWHPTLWTLGKYYQMGTAL